jgi:predicted hotdog family 3-hydroxylacyl-ACP dehydratase
MSTERRRAADFVPHRPPMLCLDEVGDETENRVVCYTTLRPDFIFIEDGRISAAVLIELVAQASAVYLGVKAVSQGRPPRFGMLVGCREAELLVPELAVGDELTVTVDRLFEEPEVSAFAGTVTRRGAVIGRVSVSVIDGGPAVAATAPPDREPGS